MEHLSKKLNKRNRNDGVVDIKRVKGISVKELQGCVKIKAKS